MGDIGPARLNNRGGWREIVADGNRNTQKKDQ
ncbi:hypothetical protein GGD46_005406 [Rhizobium lusitanum]|uniref:Uncharacterized protein n=1 Tax=Rhizobium lusitanum TaxID=293958 RepID=A0A7X0MGE2_9HYPH|nr:hypothetical protein [Rhizobium lusitanum]